MGNMRLLNLNGENMEDEHQTPPPETGNRYIWWFVALIVLHLISLVNVQYTNIQAQRDNALMRRELDDNAVLIRQLQERQVVRDLANIRKGATQ